MAAALSALKVQFVKGLIQVNAAPAANRSHMAWVPDLPLPGATPGRLLHRMLLVIG